MNSIVTIFNAFFETLQRLWLGSGFANLTIQHLAMIIIACVLLYLAIVK